MYDYPLELRTIGHILADKADKADRLGHRAFRRHRGDTVSHADAHRLPNQYAHGFATAGIGRGDHMALTQPDRPELLWALRDLGELGAVGVQLDAAGMGALLTYLLDQSDSILLGTTDELRERRRRAAQGAPGLRAVIGVDELRGCGVGMPAVVPPGLAQTRAEEPHLSSYPSGTTGPSQGAVGPHSPGHAVGRQMTALPDDRRHRPRLATSVLLSRSMVEGFTQRYGVRVASAFALTENCAATLSAPEDPVEEVPSAGRVHEHMAVRVRSKDGEDGELAAGSVGEIGIPPTEPGSLMSGYCRMPESAWAGSWLHPGDRISTRTGSCSSPIARRRRFGGGGEPLGLRGGDGVVTSSRWGRRRRRPLEWGWDEVMADLEAELSYREILEYSGENRAHHMVPRYPRVVDELPKTPSEKIEKYELEQNAAVGPDPLGDRESEGITVRRS